MKVILIEASFFLWIKEQIPKIWRRHPKEKNKRESTKGNNLTLLSMPKFQLTHCFCSFQFISLKEMEALVCLRGHFDWHP
ncbi:hypothetical protein NC651_036320 [Populus alba x Populus x berolinensis]|nr:hypothetical protein NC651_036320 [Populus alba x Populus x berolinensis]